MDKSGPRLRDALVPVVVGAIAMAVLRVVYLATMCPYTLIEDEAQYWVWSRMLDWSYYTKGPGVAWAIALATSVLGDGEWVVRLPAVVSSVIAQVAIAGLAFDVSRSVRPCPRFSRLRC
jgi:4-amino-4-deoxy-L-arabinose transferase-like glycosyltransferase